MPRIAVVSVSLNSSSRTAWGWLPVTTPSTRNVLKPGFKNTKTVLSADSTSKRRSSWNPRSRNNSEITGKLVNSRELFRIHSIQSNRRVSPEMPTGTKITRTHSRKKMKMIWKRSRRTKNRKVRAKRSPTLSLGEEGLLMNTAKSSQTPTPIGSTSKVLSMIAIAWIMIPMTHPLFIWIGFYDLPMSSSEVKKAPKLPINNRYSIDYFMF